MSKPAEIVHAYLDAMEARDLERAGSFLADGFLMTFPGGATFTTPQQLIDWSHDRYRSVKKVYKAIDEASGDGVTVVYCFGTLQGQWPDGTSFSGIRFIDRFELNDGRITEQQVWNDLAEHRR